MNNAEALVEGRNYFERVSAMRAIAEASHGLMTGWGEVFPNRPKIKANLKQMLDGLQALEDDMYRELRPPPGDDGIRTDIACAADEDSCGDGGGSHDFHAETKVDSATSMEDDMDVENSRPSDDSDSGSISSGSIEIGAQTIRGGELEDLSYLDLKQHDLNGGGGSQAMSAADSDEDVEESGGGLQARSVARERCSEEWDPPSLINPEVIKYFPRYSGYDSGSGSEPAMDTSGGRDSDTDTEQEIIPETPQDTPLKEVRGNRGACNGNGARTGHSVLVEDNILSPNSVAELCPEYSYPQVGTW